MINSKIYYDEQSNCLYYMDDRGELMCIPPTDDVIGLFHHIDNAYSMPWYTLDDTPRLYFEKLRNALEKTILHD